MKRYVRLCQLILLISGWVLLYVGHTTAMPIGGCIELVALVAFALLIWWSDGAEIHRT